MKDLKHSGVDTGHTRTSYIRGLVTNHYFYTYITASGGGSDKDSKRKDIGGKPPSLHGATVKAPCGKHPREPKSSRNDLKSEPYGIVEKH